MKTIFILLFFIPIMIFGQAPGENKPYARQLTETAHKYFRSDPRLSILYSDSAAIEYKKTGNYRWQAISLQNIAFAYDEGLNIPDSTLHYMELAREIFIQMKDTNGIANNLKYVGLVEGRLGKLSEGRKDINTAIELFKSTGFTAGVAVSFFDMAGLFEVEGKLDSSLVYYEMNRNYFHEQHDKSRVFVATNKIMAIQLKKEKYDLAKKEFDANWKYIKSKDIDQSNLLEFYKLSQPNLTKLGYEKRNAKIESAIQQLEKDMKDPG